MTMPYHKRTFIITWWWAILYLLVGHFQSRIEAEVILEAHLSQHSVTGTITFTQSNPGDLVSIKLRNKTLHKFIISLSLTFWDDFWPSYMILTLKDVIIFPYHKAIYWIENIIHFKDLISVLCNKLYTKY